MEHENNVIGAWKSRHVTGTTRKKTGEAVDAQALTCLPNSNATAIRPPQAAGKAYKSDEKVAHKQQVAGQQNAHRFVAIQ